MVPLSAKLPLKELTDITPAVPPPPPLVKQVAQLRLPAASRPRGPLADTATVPDAFGKVMVLLVTLGAANTKLFLTPAALALKLVLPSPWRLKV